MPKTVEKSSFDRAYADITREYKGKEYGFVTNNCLQAQQRLFDRILQYEDDRGAEDIARYLLDRGLLK